MATVTNIARQADQDPVGALERNRTEDTRLMQRINAAASELHRLWSMDSTVEDRRTTVAALQAEIDGLYERRRQLVAERTLLRERGSSRASRRGVWAWPDAAAA